MSEDALRVSASRLHRHMPPNCTAANTSPNGLEGHLEGLLDQGIESRL